MPPAICDSEGEEEEVFAQERPSQSSIISWAAKQIDAVAVQLFDGADDRATGSTDTAQLEAEIRNAAWGLFGTDPSQHSQPKLNSSQIASGSHKRSHTDYNIARDASQSSNKRSKTFGGACPVIPPQPGLSEHSAMFNEPQMPFQGSLFEDFVNHEPFGMFQETGDTVADMSSCQERLVAEAIADFGKSETISTTRPTPVELPPSPSFPYSSSTRPTQKAVAVDHVEHVAEEHSSEYNIVLDLGPEHVHSVADDACDTQSLQPPPHLSPVTLLPTGLPETNTPFETQAMPKTGKLRSRKRTMEIDTMNNMGEDELLVELPKEQYQPRPSRRRATDTMELASPKATAPKQTSKKRRKTDDQIDPSKSEAIAVDMKPPPSVGLSGRKGIRSHTTIFEDHINSDTSLKSPSLSQRQALRRSVLKDISNEPAEQNPKPRRQSRKILVDSEDDDEDELGKISDVEDTIPLKRGRGRPSKGKPKKATSVGNSANAIPDELDAAVGAPEPRVKKGRGRPAKNKVAESKVDDKVIEDEEEIEPDAGSSRVLEAVVIIPPQTTPSVVSSTHAPTPPPEPPAKCTPEPKPSKLPNGPVTHSPIKKCLTSTSKYRVGLSKRQRIQPLHSSIRKR
ncbi:uncharacterized protein K489DRAFT_254782 [Dissoconium aciculare CBS 342.82]|uniref:Uncharacterized protein n=1 Tax=Dissoconium aciculare CBS 342.82 TaxID=1314786 RepID=A0A6J3M2J2_9PEZI|nr:uncharacterized protein K489DRAFT_254782 [Dissoconium aciculare CBS 342.82]KAF1821719.1 hypothetical protein K489DRAFT_254782 [Dissoconium aciculare CBS 342.82]